MIFADTHSARPNAGILRTSRREWHLCATKDHNKLVEQKDIVTAVSAVDVRQRPKPETKKSTVVKATTEGSSGSQAKGRQLKNLAFNFSGRTIMMEDVDLGTTFGKLRERVVRENNLGAYNIYFIFGTRKLDEGKFPLPLGLVWPDL